MSGTGNALLLAHEGRMRKVEQVARWRLRKLLASLPAKPAETARGLAAPRRIAYLFAGTYGDFVQILPALRRLASAYPGADLVLCGGRRYAREFSSEVPRSLRLAGSLEPWSWMLSPADLLFTNAVGVFRGSFDLAARLCARKSFGFRHSEEPRRGGYSRTTRLDAAVTSFHEENLKVLDLAQVPECWGVGPGPGTGFAAPSDAALSSRPAEPWGRGRILFHIGSAGLKQDFGLPTYAGIISEILAHLEDRQVELLKGPDDGEVAESVRASSRVPIQEHPMPKLIRMLRAFEGTILCFNSFLAHLCHYLGKPALVIHKGAVPYGYDCSVIHRQIVLVPENGWNPREVLEALGVPRPSPDLPAHLDAESPVPNRGGVGRFGDFSG
jgi:ADP-heptose:LPS heptosyltransferase